MQTYAIYTRCDHCGIYDRDPAWCALCRRPKQGKESESTLARPAHPPKSSAGWTAGPRRRN